MQSIMDYDVYGITVCDVVCPYIATELKTNMCIARPSLSTDIWMTLNVIENAAESRRNGVRECVRKWPNILFLHASNMKI